MYFDHPQEPTPEERGFYWGTRYTDAFKSFSFMPDNYFLNADIKRSGEPITLAEICGKDNAGCPSLEKPENILGNFNVIMYTDKYPRPFECSLCAETIF